MKCFLCKKQVYRVLTDELRDGTRRKVFYCIACQLGMLSENRSASELKKFYSKEYRTIGKPKLNQKSDAQELFDIYVPFQADRIRFLKPYLTKQARLLDIGCSSGMFLFHAKKYVKEVVGIDYDVAAAEFAAKKCRCRVYTEDIEKTDLPPKHFDIICLFQTVEHIPNPHELLTRLKMYLKPGGIIAIEVPNLHDALNYAYDLPLYHRFFFHASHLWYFTAHSMQKLMIQAGFKGEISYVQDYNVMNHMYWLHHDKPQDNCIPGLSEAALPLRSELPMYTKTELARFIRATDRSYKKELARLGITSNLFYIGKVK
ncbi:MAG: hypothetical protein A3G58_02880 [Candidatus Colwellbacteria bacterium RIFCSPLOWO2_12_FULL_46_17]|uniref:Methyltransferase domain-containing protein n=1 Tax=Candidatus Colwellbacteria bacterium RIFCSPLOWO2_12_FULL_46_17 TaxID=1797695 RepID=A0A1G1ZDG4_9BACT|nr:MAG: hypothetical protein A3G58_02880 [Candidatus Colwellbacteria bacterium RIFCSPLOWO2_12_FULL_46_17]